MKFHASRVAAIALAATFATMLAACGGSPPPSQDPAANASADAAPAPSTPSASSSTSTAAAATVAATGRRGAYTYFADTGLFVDCASGERLVVAQEADNKALEAAYIAGRSAPEEAMLATVIGRVESRVNMEGPARPMLIVEQFISIRAGGCETASTASLENTYWALVRVGANAVALAEGQGEPFMVLHSNDKRVAGMSGCNRMMGGYTVTGDKVAFTQMAGTMMACDKGMDVEQAFLQALGAAAGWRITGETLELTDASGTPVAAFESRYLH